jgi:hypothetical protein
MHIVAIFGDLKVAVCNDQALAMGEMGTST